MAEYDINKRFWRSKRWWAAVVAALIPVANAVFGWQLNVEEILPIVTPIIIYIIAQAAVDSSH